MIVTKVAKRYAAALFQQAMKDKVLETVAEDMRLIREITSGSHEFQYFLKSQIISRENKRKVLEEVFSKKINTITQHFISLILEKRRENQLLFIAVAFDELYKTEQGLIDVEVMVVTRPDQAQDSDLIKALETRTGKKVKLYFTEDASLMGGMAVRIGDTVIDGTIKHKLQQIENRFHQQAGI